MLDWLSYLRGEVDGALMQCNMEDVEEGFAPTHMVYKIIQIGS